jgi:uncharacterized OB-fold protein
MNEYNKPLPAEDPDSAVYWEGCRQKKLMLQHCSSCSKPRYPANNFCPHCRDKNFTWKESLGKGRLYSWIVVRHPVPKEIYAEDVPYIVALIDLEEGVRIASNIVGCEPESITPDMTLQVIFKPVTEQVTLPLFEPTH